MTSSIMMQIEKQMAEMTAAQRKVAEYIFRDTMEASFSTIEQISRSAGVSTTSVIRLANTLGFASFSEFQKALKDYLRANSSPINKLSLNTNETAPEGTGSGILDEVYSNELENITLAMQTLNEDTLRAIAKKLDGARNIYICGARTSESVARYLTYNLNRMFMNATYVGDSFSGELAFLKKIGPEDVLIAATISRYNKSVCKMAATCKSWGVPVIAVTDSYDSPLVPSSEYQLIGRCHSNAFHNSITAQIFLCDALIKICSQINTKRVRENLRKDEKIVAEMDYFIRK